MHQVEPLSMSWCLDCHRNPTPHLRPLTEITNMTWKPARDPEARARQIAAAPRPAAARLLGMPPVSARATGAASAQLEESAEARAFREREFPEGASEPPEGISRRTC